MILVVFAHVETFMFSIDPGETFISSLFISFRMPLFFFISGYISCNVNKVWDKTLYIRNIVKKIRIQLIPTFFFGLLFTYLFSKGDIFSFINNYHKYGYWFTFCLLGMFIILYLNNLIICVCVKNKKNKKIAISLFTIAILLFVFKYGYDVSPRIRSIADIFCFHQVCMYFPFFIIGYIASLFKESFNDFLDNQKIQVVIFTLFCITFYFQYTLPTYVYEANYALLIYRMMSYILVGFLGICIVYNFFRKNSAFFSKQTKVGTTLQKIGVRTLDVYMIHYFFLSKVNLGGLDKFLRSNIILELFIGALLSVIIVYCCIFVANLLRISKNLSYYLFGTTLKKNE